MESILLKRVRRARRKKRVRKKVLCTSERPRVTGFRSSKPSYAQAMVEWSGGTLCSASTRDKALASQFEYGGNKAAATKVGTALAESIKSNGVDKLVFDRNGFTYHGRVKALADAVREAGIRF